LPPESLTTLFERYAQLEGGQVRQGSGLGLYFCRLVAEAHGGRIDYEAAADGPSFVVRLPGRA
jgi:signal transduction histidine kinase